MKAMRIRPEDNVAVALCDLAAGETVSFEDETVTLKEGVKRGHKIALCEIRKGDRIIKYGTAIASAREVIACGAWVHTHNAVTNLTDEQELTYTHAVYPLPDVTPRSFMGYRRADGTVGVRNELWVIPVVGCVNGIAAALVKDNQDLVTGSVEGLYHFPHPYGCSQLGDDLSRTKDFLASMAHHGNAGGILFLGLGCENITPVEFREAISDADQARVRYLCCQDVTDELAEGKKLLRELAETAGRAVREELPSSELIIGMKCGGSDGLSGISANPTVGRLTDHLIAQGGTAILTEVPEMFGAERMLFSRCENEEVFQKAVAMTESFKHYFTEHGQTVYENPSPGNLDGGITTLEDKSCGCVQKGGRGQITDVLSYAERVRKKGLHLMWGPGNDLVSASALTAAGAHLILFTTGRGTPFGAVAPTLKIASNTPLYEQKRNWIDFNAGTVADGTETIDEAAERLLTLVLETASGKSTRAEMHGCRELAIFKDGVIL